MSTESEEASRDGARQLQLPFPVVSDESEQLLDALSLRHEDGGLHGDVFYTSSYLVSADGIVRYALAADNLRRRATPDEVIAAANRAVAGALK